jgi:phospholipid/cholesterol/gamma-HCH transport system permease protein
MGTAAQPSISHRRAPDGTVQVQLLGRWVLRTTRERTVELLSELAKVSSSDTHWDLTRLEDLDVAGATLLWRSWLQQRPAELAVRPEDERIFRQLALLPVAHRPAAPSVDFASPFVSLGEAVRSFGTHALGMLELLGRRAVRSRCSAPTCTV